MAHKVVAQNGDSNLTATWVGGIVPISTDTIESAYNLNCVSAFKVASTTVKYGGRLTVQSYNVFESAIITYEAGSAESFLGSGDKLNPTKIWCDKFNKNTVHEWGWIGTDSQYDADSKEWDLEIESISQTGTSPIVASSALYHGTMKNVCIKNYRTTNFINGLQNTKSRVDLFEIGNCYFLECGASNGIYNSSISTDDIIIIDNNNSVTVTYNFNTCYLYGKGSFKIINPTGSFGGCTLSSTFDTVSLYIDSAINFSFVKCRALQGSKLFITDNGYVHCIYDSSLSNNEVTINIKPVANSNAGYISFIDVGTMYVNSTVDCTLSYKNYEFKFDSLIVDCNAVVNLNKDALLETRFQHTRSRSFRIKNATTVNQFYSTENIGQPEPVNYMKNETSLMSFIWSLKSNASNYDVCYGDSVGWNKDTNTLSDGGKLIINTEGLDGGLAINSLASHTTSIVGSLSGSEVVKYQISFNDGLDFSTELTEAELQTNMYTINGNGYTTSPRYNMVLKTVIYNTTGVSKTITRIDSTGMGIDTTNPYPITDTERLIELKKDIGDPYSLNGGSADLVGMIGDAYTEILATIEDILALSDNVFRWDFTTTPSKLIFRNATNSADIFYYNVYKDDGISKPTTSQEVGTRGQRVII